MNEKRSSTANAVKGPGGHNFKDISGRRFGRLVAIERIPAEGGNALWRCRCDCGANAEVRSQKLISYRTKSCGCLRTEITGNQFRKHGLARTVEHAAWVGMSVRCYNPRSPSFRCYGGRGIKVCRRWRESFTAFLGDMGPRPKCKTSIDRYPNRDGNYEPTNCRWANAKEQGNNTNRNHFISYKGITLTMKQWAETLGLRYDTLAKRLNKLKWSPERALTNP